MTEQPVDPNEHDEHTAPPEDLPSKKHGDALEEVVTDRPQASDDR